MTTQGSFDPSSCDLEAGEIFLGTVDARSGATLAFTDRRILRLWVGDDRQRRCRGYATQAVAQRRNGRTISIEIHIDEGPIVEDLVLDERQRPEVERWLRVASIRRGGEPGGTPLLTDA